MKVNYKLLMFGFLGLFLLSNCKKETGPNHLPLLPELTKSPVPMFMNNPDLDLIIIEGKADDFHAGFSLDLYFPEDVQPASADLDVVMNGDFDDVRKLKTDITTFPYDIEFSGEDLADLFDINVEDIVPGYDFEVRASFVLADGTELPGFADGIKAREASSDLNNFPGDYSTSVTYRAVCPLDLEALLGEMEVNDPFFWEGSYPVTVTQKGDYTLEITGINEDPSSVIEIEINPRSFTATVSDQLVDAAPPYLPYTNLTMDGTGLVNSCDNSISLNLEWYVDQGSFGDGPFILGQP